MLITRWALEISSVKNLTAKDREPNVTMDTSLMQKGVFSNKGPEKEARDLSCLCTKNCHVINWLAVKSHSAGGIS